MAKDSKMKYLLVGVAVFLSVSIMAAASLVYFLGDNGGSKGGTDIPPKVSSKIEKFKSKREFEDFIKEIDINGGYGMGGGSGIREDFSVDSGNDLAAPSTNEDSASSPDRVSGTNVQVLSIDEPDIVKTDGEYLYISREEGYMYEPMPVDVFIDEGGSRDAESIIEPYHEYGDTLIVKAFPIEELSKTGEINQTGEMLLFEEKLIFIDWNGITAYDVSNPESPKKTWSSDFNSSYNTARLYDGELYVVTTDYLSGDDDCDFYVMESAGDSLTVPCTNIYHPEKNSGTDTVFNVVKINPNSGKVNDSLSFVGSNYSSVVYMSENYLYLSYPQNQDEFAFLYEFISLNQDLFSSNVVEKIDKLNTYDISTVSKNSELETIMSDYTRFMDDEERDEFEKDTEDRFTKYVEENKRSLSYTGVIKVSADTLDIEASGVVPGSLLNQFSMDEYEGNLRVVTTIGDRMWWGLLDGQSEEENDLYILDHSLDIKSSIQGMGLDERIYSARFVGDQAYMVTFKQIDPFFVFDLSDPSNPVLKGELKIPGYSSYLHPVDDDTIIGVGEEAGQVKVSLFDVSNPSDPREVSNYKMDEYWSEAVDNHHAFTIDKDNEVFFIPASNGGYVISYGDDEFTLKIKVNASNTKRAVYVDEMLYIIGQDFIKVYDERTWKEITSLEL